MKEYGGITIIRDGIDTKQKYFKKSPINVKTTNYKEDLFSDIISVYQIYNETNDLSYARYIKDPYGIALLLNPIGREVEYEDDYSEYPKITCEQYYKAVLSGDLHGIIHKMTEEEILWMNLFYESKGLPQEEVITNIAKENEIDIPETIDCWKIQPDVEAMAFALGSPRAVTEGVTPVIGLPLNLSFPSESVDGISFPGMVERDYGNNNLIQIHKDGDLFVVYDKDKREIELTEEQKTPLMDEMSYVLTAWLMKGKIIVNDILCINDIWLYRRPYLERVNLLWRFAEYSHERLIVRDQEQLTQQIQEKKNIIFKNLNGAYDPTSRLSIIAISSPIQTCILKVGSRRGGRGISYLLTEDKRPVFEIPAKIEKEDRGDLIEVKKDGTVLRIVKRMKPDTWGQVATKWGYDLDYDKYGKFKRLPRCTWFENYEDEVRRRNKDGD